MDRSSPTILVGRSNQEERVHGLRILIFGLNLL